MLARRRLLAATLMGVAAAAGLRAVSAPPPETVPVLVARHDLAAGTLLSRTDVVTAQFAPGTAPAGLAADPLGRSLAAPLRSGEPVTDVRLVGPGLAEGHPGLVAVPLRLPDPGAVGLLRAGDRIDLLATDPRGRTARLLVPGALVLAVPAADGDLVGGVTGGRLVVLGVPEYSREELAGAAVQDFLSFSFAR